MIDAIARTKAECLCALEDTATQAKQAFADLETASSEATVDSVSDKIVALRGQVIYTVGRMRYLQKLLQSAKPSTLARQLTGVYATPREWEACIISHYTSLKDHLRGLGAFPVYALGKKAVVWRNHEGTISQLSIESHNGTPRISINVSALELSKPACRMLGIYNPEHNGLHFSLPPSTPLSPAFELMVAPDEITNAVIWASSSRLAPPPFEILPSSGGTVLWSKKGYLHYKAKASNA